MLDYLFCLLDYKYLNQTGLVNVQKKNSYSKDHSIAESSCGIEGCEMSALRVSQSIKDTYVGEVFDESQHALDSMMAVAPICDDFGYTVQSGTC
ncbi:hypothetical protein [Fulvivirga sediminis]|uniref:Uncharacterized protein n=1 Tax=Fulvivirga sediminis TaxID=2803949 RepID=A0A937F9E0_9BACT|nr:hypothetical protein [Fulvivirga sediminis]MBL3657646.1 hypothetical protein [Fulvivirga sediminis]